MFLGPGVWSDCRRQTQEIQRIEVEWIRGARSQPAKRLKVELT